MIDSSYPLIDIHRHLDGNIRPSTIWQLAKQHNIALPAKNLPAFLSHVQVQDSEANLLAFLKKLDWGVAVLKTLDDCKRIAYENVEDAFYAGLDYAELRFSPYYMAKNHQLNVTEVVAAVIDGITSGMKHFDININLIGILSRTFGVKHCQTELESLLVHKESLVAIDLAGDESNYPGELFVDHFAQVKNADLQVTIHAGEAANSTSVWQAIQQLHAKRIGHGVACAVDEKLMHYMAQHNIAIESCLTSNYQTGTVADLSQHPVKLFLENNLLVCLNTDDPAVENIELADEYRIAKQQLGLSNEQLKQLQVNSLHASFLSDSEKQQLLNKAQQKTHSHYQSLRS
jgi:adenosine deaminase